MATSFAGSPGQPAAAEGTNGLMRNNDDPFTGTPAMRPSRPHRYSSFDTGLFTENHPSSSPSHAKRALEAHLAETERRLQEASKLGTNLVEQRQKLSARLREVEVQQNQHELRPELRQRLIDIEKEYNEVGRESARAFLAPRSDSAGNVADSETPFALDGRKTASPAKFSSQATDSPSKLNVPRKQRNQSTSQIQDIELAAQISTSLLGQVRQLQGMLSEKDGALKTANFEVSRLETEAQGFSQRLRSMDESDQRYKDENWNLETQLHDLSAESRETAAREHKIQHALTLATTEKNAVFRELDDLKQTHGRTIDDHALMRKNQDSELGSLRRDLSHGEKERSTLQRKIEELTSQNQELAKAFSGRFREEAPEQAEAIGSDAEANPIDRSDTDHSPPPSPSKANQRHSMLETETLKSSLHHAHRTIQNLKGNVHREKTEKLELKRMLQDARDELDVRRSEMSNNKRLKSKSHQDLAKKAVRPNMLGAGRNSRTDITVDEPGWEDRSMNDSPQPAQAQRRGLVPAADVSMSTDVSDAYQTANETEDGFETAQERDYPTENEAIPTGSSEMGRNSSDDMTETEGGLARGATIRTKRPSTLIAARDDGLSSYRSTASTSADEDDSEIRTPNHAQPQKYRVRLNRGSRKSLFSDERLDSSPLTARDSPASFVGGNGSSNLLAELDDVNGVNSGDDGTPSRGLVSQLSTPSMRRSVSSQRSASKRRRSVSSQRSSQSLRPSNMLYSGNEPPVPRIPVVDSGTMTEPWQPELPKSELTGQGPANYGTPTKGTPGLVSESADPATATPQGHLGGIRADNTPSTTRSTPPRTVWDQPLSMFSNIIPTFAPGANTTPLSAKSSTTPRGTPADSQTQAQRSSIGSFADANDFEVPSSTTQRHGQQQPDRQPDVPMLSLSTIQGIYTTPVEVPQTFHDRSLSATGAPAMQDDSNTGEVPAVKPMTTRILGSMFGPSEPQKAAEPMAMGNDTAKETRLLSTTPDNDDRFLRDLPPSNTQKGLPDATNPYTNVSKSTDTIDHGAQTLLSADQIESLIRQKEGADVSKQAAVPPMKPLSAIGATSPPASSSKLPDPFDLAKGRYSEQAAKEAAPLAKGLKRPNSANSIRLSNSSGNHPPLPPDHQQAIAAAAQRTSTSEPPNVMGPPLMPASAYKSNTMRPRTPSRINDPKSAVTPASRSSTTPRARHSTARSRTSRRSSVSSFESELDERFNIRLDGMPMPDGMDGGTDPRMIQAITQTMIGEFLWKYTRKAGRGDMSNNRHRRFFWVHPYTRTLYWSDRDPSTAGRAQLKAKSVAIEAVRVVSDDNPMPPGLHRKSLIVVTPGRSIKFTAQTSQRHETWFNALSYLLLRTGPEGAEGSSTNIDDILEFNPTFGQRESSRTRGSRISLASFRTRGRTPEPPQHVRSLSRTSLTRQPTGAPAPSTSQQDLQQQQQQQQQEQDANTAHRGRRNSGGLGSRISAYWRPNRGTSISSRASQQSATVGATPAAATNTVRSRRGSAAVGGVYRPTSSAAGSRQGSESDLDLRERQRELGLENVRSCCDGKHDVGSLQHRGGSAMGRYESSSAGGAAVGGSVRSSREGGVK
ncbi:MAG: hypothetical protein Q9220_000350 [cf. Caloplaca sp. 1 TL-2023]